MRVASVRDLQSLVRSQRKHLGMTQDQLAERMGVSRKWVYTFETGSPNAVELALVLRLLAALDLQLDVGTEDDLATATAPAVDLNAHLREFVSPSGAGAT